MEILASVNIIIGQIFGSDPFIFTK